MGLDDYEGCMVSGLFNSNEPPLSGNYRRNAARHLRGINPTKAFLYLIVLCIIGYFIVFWYVNFEGDVDRYVEQLADEDVVEAGVGLKSIQVDRKCSPTMNRCYMVSDSLISTQQGSFVERTLLVEGFENESDSAVRLKAPNDEKFEDSDTRFWEVDHSTLGAQYLAAMFIAPFAVTTFSMDNKNEEKTILEIGLGGGSFDMFLRQREPKINITTIELEEVVVSLAHKWFGIVNDEYRRTIVGDGAAYLEKAAKRGDRYDVFLLDACDTSKIRPCPAQTFLDLDVIQHMKDVVKDSGIAVINILDLEGHEPSIKEVAKRFASVFPSCAAMHLSDEFNVILVCFPHQITNPSQQLRFYESQIASVIQRFNLEYIIEHVVLSALY